MTNDELLLEISSTMQTQLQPVFYKLDQLDDRIGNLEAETKELNSRVGRLEAGMEELNSRVGRLEAGMEELNSRVGRLEAEMQELRSRVELLETGMEELNSRVGNLESETKDMKSRLEQSEAESRETKLLIETEVLPLQKELSAYNMSTYKRYLDSVEKMDVMEKNQQVIMRVVADHGRKLKQLS